jgi:hypothetical protein
MRLDLIAQELELSRLNDLPVKERQTEVLRGYASDLLSDVLANAPPGGLLVTIQVHMNVVAVASHAELAGIIFSSGLYPDEAVRRKATEEWLPIFGSQQCTFDLVGRLYELGLRGTV